ncbi:MAG TPA: hypothetical protein VHP32_01555 [Ignavibacteria bacterium]|nr:hypothetical protein [Ignavibacteria bacterium]
MGKVDYKELPDKRVEIFTTGDKYYKQGFDIYKHSQGAIKSSFIISRPNFPSLFLNISDNSIREAEQIYKKEICPFILYNREKDYFEMKDISKEFLLYDCLEKVFVGIVFSYTFVESIINNLIPNDIKFEWEKNGEKFSYGKIDIERKMSTTDKIKKVITKCFNININFAKLECWQDFKYLEYLRNEIIHFKAEEYIENKIVVAPRVSEMFVCCLMNNLLDSSRNLIKYLSGKIEKNMGLPHEFYPQHINFKEHLEHFKKKG